MKKIECIIARRVSYSKKQISELGQKSLPNLFLDLN